MTRSPENRRANISDVAKRAGVSTATVSRVINANFPVTNETAAKVRTAIAELKFVPNASARMLAGGKTHLFGLVIPEIASISLISFLAGIEAAVRTSGYGLLIYSTGVVSVSGEALSQVLNENNTDGLIVYVNSLAEEELARLSSMNYPIVLLHRTPPKNLPIPYITFQNKKAAQLLVDHLIEVHGYRRIAWLYGPEGHEDSFYREMGYRVSLHQHNIPFNSELVGYGGFNFREARKTVGSWLDRNLKMDAIFAGADEAAFGAITAITEAGLRVPEDIAVVGFDDIDLGRHLFPPLTTIRADFEEAGRQAVLQLVKLVKTGKASKRVIVPTELVIRRSCNCSAGNQVTTDSS